MRVQDQTRNPKSEIRNKSQRLKFRRSETTRPKWFRTFLLGILGLFRISDFGFRIYSILAACLLFVAVPSPAAITHRWSLTETSGAVVDSIAGSNGVVVLLGTNSYRTNGVITLTGGARASADYVQLPGGLVHTLTNVTVELWATPNAGQTWSRIFDFGPGNNTQAGTFYLSFCQGSTSLNAQRFEFNSPATWKVDTTVATSAGTQYQS